MLKVLQADSLVRIVGGILLTLVGWQAKCLCDSVDSLGERLSAVEKSLVEIGTKLDMHMAAGGIPGKPGIWAGLGGDPDNQRNQTTEKKSQFSGFSP